jgi:hypothetical protein
VGNEAAFAFNRFEVNAGGADGPSQRPLAKLAADELWQTMQCQVRNDGGRGHLLYPRGISSDLAQNEW